MTVDACFDTSGCQCRDWQAAKDHCEETREAMSAEGAFDARWVKRPWRDCSSKCGEGWQFRHVFCSTGNIEECDSGAMPVQTRACTDYSMCYFGCSVDEGECAELFPYLSAEELEKRRLEERESQRQIQDHPLFHTLPACDDKRDKLFCMAHSNRGECHLPWVHQNCERTCGACDAQAKALLAGVTDYTSLDTVEDEIDVDDIPDLLVHNAEEIRAPHHDSHEEPVEEVVVTADEITTQTQTAWQPGHWATIAGLLLVAFWAFQQSR